MQVEVEFDGFDEIAEEIMRQLREIALEVAQEVPLMIKDKASLEGPGFDVYGNPITPKIPRPKHNPTNLPNLPLVQTGNMYDEARWTFEECPDGAEVVYEPPDYFQYVIEKRPWLLPDGTINGQVAEQIRERFIEKWENR